MEQNHNEERGKKEDPAPGTGGEDGRPQLAAKLTSLI